MNLNFIQSNWVRCYPFRFNQGVLDLNNNSLPTSILVGLRISCSAADLEVYINKICINNGAVGISFAGANGDIGYANAVVTKDNQYISIVGVNGGVIGNVLIGDREATLLSQTYLFDNVTGLIEPSTVLVLSTPAVTGLVIKGKKYVGDVKLTSTSLNITSQDVLTVDVKNTTTIKSRNDKQAAFLSCTNTVISGINSVTPSKTGNIDIFTISPLRITVDGNIVLDSASLTLDETSTLAGNLCRLINDPPVDDSNIYGNIFTATAAEWTDWSQYQI